MPCPQEALPWGPLLFIASLEFNSGVALAFFLLFYLFIFYFLFLSLVSLLACWVIDCFSQLECQICKSRALSVPLLSAWNSAWYVVSRCSINISGVYTWDSSGIARHRFRREILQDSWHFLKVVESKSCLNFKISVSFYSNLMKWDILVNCIILKIIFKYLKL